MLLHIIKRLCLFKYGGKGYVGTMCRSIQPLIGYVTILGGFPHEAYKLEISTFSLFVMACHTQPSLICLLHDALCPFSSIDFRSHPFDLWPSNINTSLPWFVCILTKLLSLMLNVIHPWCLYPSVFQSRWFHASLSNSSNVGWPSMCLSDGSFHVVKHLFLPHSFHPWLFKFSFKWWFFNDTCGWFSTSNGLPWWWCYVKT